MSSSQCQGPAQCHYLAPSTPSRYSWSMSLSAVILQGSDAHTWVAAAFKKFTDQPDTAGQPSTSAETTSQVELE